MLLLAGVTINFTKGATFFPFRIWAAVFKSSNRPLVQEPMNTWSILISFKFETASILSTWDGQAQTGTKSSAL